jgi:diaminohydroxyphosphoribosylaminopyrimidine deaminase/5-amino-6-(5-phosphoribosylamino)uracil reductase
LLATAKKTPALVVTGGDAIEANPQTAEKIRKKGAEILAVPITEGRCDIKFLLDELSNRGIAQLLVEGGAEVIESFLKQALADEACVYVSPEILAARGAVGVSSSMEKLARAVDLYQVETEHFGDDVRITGLLKPQQ